MAIPRLLIFSVLWFTLLLFARNYAAQIHNEVVNRHRQNALSTFESFAGSPSADDTTKNAVLLQATQCIFAPQPSGYLKTENELPQSNQVIEIFRGAVGGKKSD